MRKNVLKRRVLAFFLMLMMVMSEFSSSGIKAFAEDAEAGYITGDAQEQESDGALKSDDEDSGNDVPEEGDKNYGVENEETATDNDADDTDYAEVVTDDAVRSIDDGVPDVVVDEDDDNHGVATWVQIVTSGSRIQLGKVTGNSETANASFSNGVLTLKNYQASDNSGGYTPLSSMGENDGGYDEEYYGIYADGDLTIELDGDSVFNLGLSKNIVSGRGQYGIKVKGSLTVRNVKGKSGSLKIDLNGKGGSGIADMTYGIYANHINFEEQSGGSLNVNITGNRAKCITSGKNGVSYGLRAVADYVSEINIKGGNITVNVVSGEIYTFGMRSYYYNQTGGTVKVCPSSNSGTSTKQTMGIYAEYTAIFTGGSLDVIANDVSTAGKSYGISGDNGVTIESDAVISAGTTSGGRSVGVYVVNNSSLNLRGKTTIKSKDYTVLAPMINMVGYQFLKPSPATINACVTENSTQYYSVYDSYNKVATEIQTDKEEGYLVWIGGHMITDSNKGNVPGIVSGSGVFTPSTRTLTLKSVKNISGTYSPAVGEYAMIYSKGDLTIELESASDMPMVMNQKCTSQYGIYVDGDLCIRNVGSKTGSLKLDLYSDGSGSGTVQYSYGIYCKGTVTVEDKSGGSITLEITPNVTTNLTCGIKAGEMVLINGGTTKVKTVVTTNTYGNGDGIYASSYTQTGGIVTVEEYTGTLPSKKTSKFNSIEADNVGVTGGVLNAYAGYGRSGSYGICCKNKFTLGADGEVNARGGQAAYDVYSCGLYGDFDCDGTNGIVIGGKFSATGKKYAVCTKTMDAGDGVLDVKSAISLANGAKLIKPSGGNVDGGGNSDKRRFIADSKGTGATEVVIGFNSIYEVKFNLNGQSGTVPATQYIEDGKCATEPTAPTASGKTFTGWYKESSCTNKFSFSTPITSDITLYAGWKNATVTYTVTFNANGHGTAPTAQTVESGKCATEPTAPTASGYRFGGWYTEAACTNLFSFKTAITKNITLYAKWTQLFTVTFNANGHGTAPSAQTVEYGKTATKPTDPTATGYTFGGWYKEASCTNAYNFGTAVKSNITLYARWTQNKTYYTVTFNMNGHGSAITAQSVESGKYANRPTDPTASGYKFVDWYTESSCTNKFSFSTAITKDTTLYAKWIQLLTVKFDMNGHGNAVASQTIEYGKTANKPADPSVDGYDFGGWYADSSCQNAFSFSTVITKDITLYAKWTRIKCIVTFYLNGDDTAPSAKMVNWGEKVAKPDDPTMEGHDFGGWYTDTKYSTAYDFSSLVKSDLSLYAKWTKKQYTVTFNVNDHGTAPSAQKVSWGNKATKPADPTAEGYTFGGWYTESSCRNAYSFDTAVKSDITLYAKWTRLQYTVTFSANGHGTAPSAQKVSWGDKATKPSDPAADGYTFGGWYKEAACTNTYDFNTAVKSNITLYAKWTQKQVDKVYYTVSFDLNGHGSDITAQTVESGKTASKPTDPTADGYTFGGWYKEANCTNAYSFSTAVTSNITLYAKWTRIQLTVTFNSNGHGTAPSAASVYWGDKVSKPADPTADGYTFGGWYKEADCTNIYEFSAPVTSNITLYAKWTRIQLTVTFNTNGHGTAPSAVKVYWGDKVTKPTDPTAEGYAFGGWYTEQACTNLFSFNTAITKSITLYAKWDMLQYTVTFNANGHGTAPSAVKVYWGKKVNKPDDPTADGYKFGGWYTDQSCSKEYDFDNLVKANITLYAKWIDILTVSFDNNGHGTKPDAQKVAKGEKVTEPAALKADGYIFEGWYTEKECKNRFDFETAITKSITLYAKWTEKKADTEYFTVTFDLNGKSGNAPSQQTIEKGKTVNQPADPEAEGYAFEGWYTEKSCTNRYDFNTAVTKNITLYAKWTELKFTVTFNENGHGTAPKTQEVKYGAKAVKPTDPVAEGFVFGGWFKEAECKALYDFNSPVKADITLYALWTEETEPEPGPENEYFIVSFDLNGHGQDIPDQTVEKGQQVTKPADPQEYGFIFAGWYKEAKCKNKYDFSQEVTSSFTLYAKWVDKAQPIEGGVSPLDPLPAMDDDTTELHLVKGQKFIIGAGWKPADKKSKKLISISKKGSLKTKKTGIAQICYEDRVVDVYISKPTVTKSIKLVIDDTDPKLSEQIALVNEDDLPVYWYSAAPDVATVDQNGNVNAVAQGKAKITAYINGSAYNCVVTVKEKTTARNRTVHMSVGSSKKISLKGVKKTLWSSADDEIGMVLNGKIMAFKVGEVTLTADAGGEKYYVKLIVEDTTLKGIDGKKNKYKLELTEGDKLDLLFGDVNRQVVFKSSKADIAFIDENGHVVARKAGKAKFSTKINGKTVTVSVKVNPAGQ